MLGLGEATGIVLTLAGALIGGLALILVAYVTVTIPLRKGQDEITRRVGPINGNGDLQAAVSKVLGRCDDLESAHGTLDEKVTTYMVTDTEAHDELRGLILAQNRTAVDVGHDLVEDAATVKSDLLEHDEAAAAAAG